MNVKIYFEPIYGSNYYEDTQKVDVFKLGMDYFYPICCFNITQ